MVSGEQLLRQQSQAHERDQIQHEFSNIPNQQQRSLITQSDPNGNNQPGQNNNSNSNAGNNGAAGGGLVGGGTSAAAAKNQLEQLNTMREALFSQDGWGCQHVNQDTNWEVPSSPEPANKDPSGGPPVWKPNINNGTDLWESNLRNGGQPPPQPVQKTPWGHTPSTNLGGTWGEDDDGTDTSNVWTGAPANAAGSQWGQGSGGPGAAGSANTGAATGSAWGDPRDMRQCAIDIRNVDPRELRTPNSDPRDMRVMIDPRDPIRGDPRGISGRLNGTSEMWGQHHPIAPHGQIPLNKMVGTATTAVPAVATGANTNTQWGAAQSVVGPKDMTAVMGTGAVGNTGIVSGPVSGGKQTTGWEEPSPPPQRRNLQNYDDGTSLWGQQSRVPGGGSHWKDMSDPMSRSHIIRGAIGNPNVGGGNGAGGNTGVSTSVGVSGQQANTNSAPMISGGPPGRLGGGPAIGGQLKPDNTMWVHPAAAAAAAAAAVAAASSVSTVRNNGAWGDDHNTSSGANWGDDKSAGMGSLSGASAGNQSWNDSTAAAAWNKNKISVPTGNVGQGGWGDANDLPSEWGGHNIAKPQAKIVGLNSDMIKGSKQYRMLVETGFKKEDVERALIATNLNFEEAADILNSRVNTIESWRRHDESMPTLGGFDHSNPGGFPARFPAANAQPSMPFPPVRNNNLLNNMGGNNVGVNPNLASLNNIQPLQVQKYLSQGGPHNVPGAQSAAGVAAFGPSAAAAAAAAAVNAVSHNSGQPTAQQLRMLVQQIQLAVQSGYLSSQILNQPLAPATLVLLNQLLSNIKHLQGAQASLARGNNANSMQMNVTIAKYKQQIANLQSQINAQQAVYVKQQQPQQPSQQQQQQQQQQHQQQQQQQQQQHPAATHVTSANVEYLRGQHDAISALQGNFSEINLNKAGGYQGAPNQQSRLNQWKLPVLDKDGTPDSTDFSRAPGATAKPNLSSSAANNMGALGLQGDGTWSTGRNIGDGWPDSTNDNENKDWPVAQPSTATAFTDLVPEFEPGKPWKGSQIKSIEDDPSITPGSVARSPLSINPTPKEADIFANTSKNSPTDLPSLSLSSSTWSFNPSTSNQNFPSWSDNVSQQCNTSSELWAAPINKSSRGPPPGLGTNKSNASGVNVSAASVTNPSVVTGSSNGWMGSGLTGRVPNSNANWSTTNSSWNSNWLLLKNLTTQIDGSTLRTLCMQHGPLINFHLYLNQGIALCKYATREEANKAQMTLNNCVLGNTTICAESPNETEVQSILQHLPPSVGQSGGPVGGAASGSNGSVNPGIVGGGNGVSSNVASSGGSGNSGGPNGPGNNNNCNNSGVGSTVSAGIGTNNAQNSGNNVGGAGSGSSAANNPAWRQQNQSRPTGRETDFEYIKNYVRSIVED